MLKLAWFYTSLLPSNLLHLVDIGSGGGGQGEAQLADNQQAPPPLPAEERQEVEQGVEQKVVQSVVAEQMLLFDSDDEEY